MVKMESFVGSEGDHGGTPETPAGGLGTRCGTKSPLWDDSTMGNSGATIGTTGAGNIPQDLFRLAFNEI